MGVQSESPQKCLLRDRRTVVNKGQFQLQGPEKLLPLPVTIRRP